MYELGREGVNAVKRRKVGGEEMADERGHGGGLAVSGSGVTSVLRACTASHVNDGFFGAIL